MKSKVCFKWRKYLDFLQTSETFQAVCQDQTVSLRLLCLHVIFSLLLLLQSLLFCVHVREKWWLDLSGYFAPWFYQRSLFKTTLHCTNTNSVYSAHWYLAFWGPAIYPLKHLCVVLFFSLFSGILCFISNCKCCFGSVSLSWSVSSLKRKDLFSRHWSSFCFFNAFLLFAALLCQTETIWFNWI